MIVCSIGGGIGAGIRLSPLSPFPSFYKQLRFQSSKAFSSQQSAAWRSSARGWASRRTRACLSARSGMLHLTPPRVGRRRVLAAASPPPSAARRLVLSAVSSPARSVGALLAAAFFQHAAQQHAAQQAAQQAVQQAAERAAQQAAQRARREELDPVEFAELLAEVVDRLTLSFSAPLGADGPGEVRVGSGRESRIVQRRRAADSDADSARVVRFLEERLAVEQEGALHIVCIDDVGKLPPELDIQIDSSRSPPRSRVDQVLLLLGCSCCWGAVAAGVLLLAAAEGCHRMID
jgi:hypothetical protein